MSAGPQEPFAGTVRAGALLAVAAAVFFGATTPLVQRAGAGISPFTTASLLYAGAALASVWPGRGRTEEALRLGDAPRLLLVAALGAVLGPTALAWGLQRTNGVAASLLLNLETLFTVVLARAVWGEPIGRRVALAVVATSASGVLLVAHAGPFGLHGEVGSLAIACATLAWAADNTLSRPLADRQPTQVVLAKSLCGAAASFAIARAEGEPWPSGGATVALLACGVVGYGLSLRLYLRAQRAIGAARTGSVFATAPFVGAAFAWALGQRADVATTVAAGALCAWAVWLHVTEHHAHDHEHDAIEHEHAHTHDDAHHTHVHEGMPDGEHTHAHRHEAVTHAHAHGLDVHHRHRH